MRKRKELLNHRKVSIVYSSDCMCCIATSLYDVLSVTMQVRYVYLSNCTLLFQKMMNMNLYASQNVSERNAHQQDEKGNTLQLYDVINQYWDEHCHGSENFLQKLIQLQFSYTHMGEVNL